MSIADVSINNRDSPKLLQVKIKQSKMDPFCQGVNIYLEKTEKIAAYKRYCSISGTTW